MGTIVPGSRVEVLPPGERYIHYIDSWNQNVVSLEFKRVDSLRSVVSIYVNKYPLTLKLHLSKKLQQLLIQVGLLSKIVVQYFVGRTL